MKPKHFLLLSCYVLATLSGTADAHQPEGEKQRQESPVQTTKPSDLMQGLICFSVLALCQISGYALYKITGPWDGFARECVKAAEMHARLNRAQHMRDGD